MPTNEITNLDDVIDSRDIIARIEALTERRDDATEGSDPLDDDEAAELAALLKVAEQAEGYASDWSHGEALIRDSYFEDYTREMLDDCGYVPKDFPTWIEIDWEATARNVQQDYTEVDFGGVSYFIRAS